MKTVTAYRKGKVVYKSEFSEKSKLADLLQKWRKSGCIVFCDRRKACS